MAGKASYSVSSSPLQTLIWFLTFFFNIRLLMDIAAHLRNTSPGFPASLDSSLSKFLLQGLAAITNCPLTQLPAESQ